MYYINTQNYLRSRLGLASGLTSGAVAWLRGVLAASWGLLALAGLARKCFFRTREMIVVHALQKEHSQSVEG